MATVNVFEQYFKAECTYNNVKRHAASVLLISTSECGNIKYEIAVNFFPHNADDDYAISYDAYFCKTVYEAAGRRSKKREKELMDTLPSVADELAADANGVIYWDQPLIEARIG
jgi:hypothetical protein